MSEIIPAQTCLKVVQNPPHPYLGIMGELALEAEEQTSDPTPSQLQYSGDRDLDIAGVVGELTLRT